MEAVIALAVALTLSSAFPTPQAETVRALAVQYADGRRTVTALSATGRVSWTATFPRVAGADTSRDGLPLFALQFEEAREPRGVAVTVALLYGRPHERRVQVATVRVIGAEPVRVDELVGFGVQPVAFSLTDIPPAQFTLPNVTTPSSYLETSVEIVTDPVPAHLVTIVNRGARDVMMLHYVSYRGRTPGVSARPRASGRLPLIRPDEAHVLNLRVPALPGPDGVPVWRAPDRIAIDSVLWSDGLVEGDGAVAADEHALDAGTALQLDRVLTLLGAAATDPAARGPAGVRAGIAALSLAVTREEAEAAAAAIPGTVRLPVPKVTSAMASGMRNARSAVLNDFDELLKVSPSPPPADYAAWLTRTIEKYAGWRRRIPF